MQRLQQPTATLGSPNGLSRPFGLSMPCNSARKASRTYCSATNFSNPESLRRLMLLPDGNWFMESSDTEANVYGTSWVMQGHHMHSQRRQSASSRQVHGLVPLRSNPPTGMALRQPTPPSDIVPLSAEDIEVSIVVLTPVDPASTGIIPFKQMLLEVSSTGTSSTTTVVEDDGSTSTSSISTSSVSSSSSSLAIVPRDNSTMLGVVFNAAVRRRDDDVKLPVDDNSVYETFNTKHPRRTMKIKFTCKRCGATTIKPVNPHAWTSGSVFARCGKCNITHKLIDNLKIFHELSGPVFNTPIQPHHPDSSSSSSNNSPAAAGDAAPEELQYDEFGFPLLPERLRLRLRGWPFADDSSDNSRLN